MLSRELAQRLDVWMAEVDAFCAAAHERLDQLEASGQEPVLDDESLDELVSSELPFYFSTDSLESEIEAAEPQTEASTAETQFAGGAGGRASCVDGCDRRCAQPGACGRSRCMAAGDLSGHTKDDADWVHRTAGGLEDRAR